MKFIDPNGHLYVGRYLDDGYSRDYYLAKLPTPSAQSTRARKSSPDPDYADNRRISYTQGQVITLVGSGFKSADAMLTMKGINQYTPPPQSTSAPASATTITTTTTTTSTSSAYTYDEATAWGVVEIFGLVTAGAAYVTVLAAPALPESGPIFGTALAITVYGTVATVSAEEYVREAGPNAKPLGALLHGIFGIFCQYTGGC